ncbi:MAG: CASC3 protein CASC3 [Coriobacteriia bacterium]|nr:CASC3 protein CASC3 [Coriobacteriia bacterium]
MAKQKVSAKQREAKIQAAKEREERAAAKKQRAEMMKKVGIVIVCVVLVLALGLPTMALTLLGGQ